MSERYKVVEGSESGHCCFEATVVDTQSPTSWPDLVCECFDKDNARKIADALNTSHRKQGRKAMTTNKQEQKA